MYRTRLVLMLVLVMAAMTSTMCCKRTQTNADAKMTPIQTGITGRVEVWEGNFMPPIPPERRAGQITPGAGRRVRVYEPVKVAGGLAEAKRVEIGTKVVAEVMADSTGHFTAAVPPGTYSIFVEEDGGWYANNFSTNGIQGEVNVEEGKLTETVLAIKTKATF